MHELPVTQELLSKVSEQAQLNSLKRVNKIFIRLGEFSGYVDESIEFYWKIIAKNTLAAEAVFVIGRVEGKIKCLSCGKVTSEKLDLCDKCGSHRLKIIDGNELVLEKIEGE